MVDQVLSNQVRYRIHSQSTFDGGADSNPAFDIIPRTSGDFTDTPAFTQSSIVDDARQARANILTGIAVEGTFASELQVDDVALKEIVQGTLQNTLGAENTYNAATISFDNATSKILDSADGFTAYSEGDYIVTYNPTDPENEQVYLIVTKVDDGDLTVTPAPNDEVAGASITVKSQSVTSSNIRRGYTVQKVLPASDGVVHDTFENCQFNTFGASVAPGSIVTTSYGLLGTIRTEGTTGIAGQTENALVKSKVSGTVEGVPQLFINNVALSGCEALITNFDITIDNGSEAIAVVGSAGACAIRHSDISVTGTLNTLVKNTVADIIAKKQQTINETEFQLGVAFKDNQNNFLVIDMPNAQYTDVSQGNTASTDTYTEDATWSANGEGDAGYTVRFTFIMAP